MIRADLLYDFRHVKKITYLASNFVPLVFKGVRREFNQRIRLGLLSQLRKYPKRRYWTGDDFVSDASRRAFFAKTGGKAYQRTGQLAAGWSTAITTNDNAITFSIENKTPWEKWVSGARQVKGHAKTGWPLHANIFTTWRPRVTDMIGDVVDDVLKQTLG